MGAPITDLSPNPVHPNLGRIGLTGASGLIGSALRQRLMEEKAEVIPLVRRKPLPVEIHWDPAAGVLNPKNLEGLNSIVHLAGRSVMAMRWTKKVRREIMESRRQGTRLLAEALANCKNPPRTLISASAIGYYGDTKDDEKGETETPGRGFLSEVCQEWEKATQPAIDAGVRVVTLRIGMVLSKEGGALKQMLPAYRLGFGGPLGKGEQWISWIHIADLTQLFITALTDDEMIGPVNAVTPKPVRQREFAQTLARNLGTKAWATTPAWLIKLLAGDLGREVLLASARIRPGVLNRRHHPWQFPTLRSALHDLLAPSQAKTR